MKYVVYNKQGKRANKKMNNPSLCPNCGSPAVHRNIETDKHQFSVYRCVTCGSYWGKADEGKKGDNSK